MAREHTSPEIPVVEMASRDTGWRGQKPLKSRRRILCPALPPGERGNSSERERERSNDSRKRHSSTPTRYFDRPPSVTLPTPKAFTATVRILYFSNDGQQADNGALHEIETNSAARAEDLLHLVRAAADVTSGRLMFKMRPVNLSLTLAELGIVEEPKALHLMLSRKLRPPEVAMEAEMEAAKISEHIAAAAASAPPKAPRQRRPIS
eukprot:CAMPEP_0169265426 /NCGR_PEP_ID=MMETSP1016-20121227/45762_1 /TAXON_ID=342587 /ORGANISM="Karlodinium micrum, Strain CCMP2283" /LENGTH=206 /DNA_ID=CAMNT_0009349073 /DNA_START=26 /DNA_END=643 /DNA_ORIENTATION=-